MIHATPPVSASIRRLIRELDALHQRLGAEVAAPHPWTGALRRSARLESIVGSASIEGFSVDDATARALVMDDRAPGSDAAEQAIVGYARAMEHIAIMSDDPEFSWSTRVMLDLHFDACSWQRDSSPGRWRDTHIYVTGSDGAVAYTAPSPADVPQLMHEIATWLVSGDQDVHHAVRAAMAHLHVVSVHPFRDGNGRISRLVQSLVLARAGILAPSLGSIEAFLARNTAQYYAELQRAHGAMYDPALDVTAWVEFCLAAHVEEASRRLNLLERAGRRWRIIEGIVHERGWPDRYVIALERALVGGLDRSGYVNEADISVATASADFRVLGSAGLIDATGRGRFVTYAASVQLRDLIEP